MRDESIDPYDLQVSANLRVIAGLTMDEETKVIVQADITNIGSDAGLLASMYDTVCSTYDTVPDK